MASTDDKPEPITAPKAEDLLPPPTKATCRVNCFVGDLGLRVLLFAATLVSVVVMVTSKQTMVVPLPGVPGGVRLPLTAKFTQSPATIYFVAALSTACLYSIITMLGSFLAILKPVYSKTILLTFALSDVVILGLVASATGTAGGVAYIGGKGNKHAGWMKLCNNYDKFCNHVTSSVAVSLLAAIVLVLLSALSTFSLYKQIRD